MPRKKTATYEGTGKPIIGYARILDFQSELEDVLDEYFPKNEPRNKGRAEALVFYAIACYLFEKYSKKK